MNLYLIDKHSDVQSPVHDQDPLVKLLSFVAFVALVVLLPRGAFVPLLAALVTVLCMTLASRVPLDFLLRRTLVIVPFVLLVGAVNLLGRGLDLAPAWAVLGDGIVRTEAAAAPKDGGSAAALVSFATMAAKSFISVFAFGLLLSTTGSAKLLAAARRAGAPAVLTVATGFMLRYVFVLAAELSRLRRSWEARRVGRLHWLTEFRYLGSLIGVLLIKSYDRAERVYLAMCSRGFDGFAGLQEHDPSPPAGSGSSDSGHGGAFRASEPRWVRGRLRLESGLFPLLLIGPVLAAALLGL